MTDIRRLVLAVLNGIVLLAGCLAATWQSTDPEIAAAADSPILTTDAAQNATSTTAAAPPSSAPPVTARPKAPVAPPPASKAYTPEPIQEIGTIEIPKIGLNHRIYHGISMRNIDRGPSHWPGTAFPGEIGNSVFAGHRVTNSKPFRHIDQLVPGDEAFFTVNGTRTRYVVTSHEIVPPTALHIVDPTPTPTATLFACHPPGSARQRYVVRLALAGA